MKKKSAFANRLFPYFLIFIVGILCYSSSLDASFTFDDSHSIVRNSAIRDISDVKAIWQVTPSRFVAYFTFALNYHVHGLNIFGYHLFNLAIHLFTALTIYWLIGLLFLTPELKTTSLFPKKNSIALAVSLIFISHPIETQAVTYIVQRMASMAALFYLLSLTLYIRARLSYDQKNPVHRLYYAASIVTALMAMFTKEIAATLPVSILLSEYFFFSPSIRQISRRLKYCFPLLLTLPVVPLVHIIARKSMVSALGVAAETDTISRSEYLLTQFNVIRSYLRLLFFPLQQSIDYDPPLSHQFFEPVTFLSFLLIVFLIALAIILFRKYRLISFGMLWFFLTLTVESSIIPIRDVMYEHRLYLPSVGIFLSVTVCLFYLLGNKPRFLFALFAITITLASFATINRNIVWKENVLLWNDAAKTAAEKFRVYANRGAAYSNLNKPALALKDFNHAIALNKDHPYPFLNRGILHLNQGNFEKALSDFNRALRLRPFMAKGYMNRGFAYMLWGKPDQAYKDFRTATMLEPRNPFYFNALGVVCNELGHYALAMVAFTKAIAINDRNVASFLNRGKTNRSMGRFRAAIKDFNRAEDLAPDIPEIYYHRGLAQVALQHYEDAVENFTRAISRNPQFVKAYANRAMAYHRLGLHKRALTDLDKAISLNSSLSKLFENRGKVYQSLGLEEDAKRDFNRAAALEREKKKKAIN